MTRAAPKKPVDTTARGGRRELFRSFGRLAIGAWIAGCTGARGANDPRPQRKVRAPDGPVSLWSWFDLPSDPRSRELSGIAWDEASRTLWAVQDNSPSIVALHPDPELKRWTFGDSVPITVGGPLDLEGIVVIPEGFIVCSEVGPRVLEVDRTGRLRAEVRVPARFQDARRNKSLESLTMSPDARYLFTTNEAALERDGVQAEPGAMRVRILRLERDRNGFANEVSEHAYGADLSNPHEMGVADLASLAEDDLLVLERGWAKGQGNTVRVYRVTLEDRASCLGMGALPIDAVVLTKRLIVDLGALAASGLPEPKQPQASALLDNYEGLAVGPRLPDGRRSLLLVSDDNGRSDQFSRILVLAWGQAAWAAR